MATDKAFQLAGLLFSNSQVGMKLELSDELGMEAQCQGMCSGPGKLACMVAPFFSEF